MKLKNKNKKLKINLIKLTNKILNNMIKNFFKNIQISMIRLMSLKHKQKENNLKKMRIKKEKFISKIKIQKLRMSDH